MFNARSRVCIPGSLTRQTIVGGSPTPTNTLYQSSASLSCQPKPQIDRPFIRFPGSVPVHVFVNLPLMHLLVVRRPLLPLEAHILGEDVVAERPAHDLVPLERV